MTPGILEKRIAVEQAHLNGRAIQSRHLEKDDWVDNSYPAFDWLHYDYRVKARPWRAEKGDWYWYVTSCGVAEADHDECRSLDAERYAAGNYFAAEETAKAAAEEIKTVLIKHQEA